MLSNNLFYLAKPFALEELMARVRALSRRFREAEPSRIEVHDLTLDLRARKVWRADKPIELSTREFGLLEYLARHAPDEVTDRMNQVLDELGHPGRDPSLDGPLRTSW